jgi:prepilin-type processing-associated H-X9-DG protein
VNGTGTNSRATRLGSIPCAAKTVWLFDSKNQPPAGSVNFTGTNMHNHAAQMAFLDGHAGRVERREVWNVPAQKWITNGPRVVFKPGKPQDPVGQ